jgi:hypothetical protein
LLAPPPVIEYDGYHFSNTPTIPWSRKMGDEARVKRYHETLDRAVSDLVAVKFALEGVQKKINLGLAVERSSIRDIRASVNRTLQAVLSLVKESSPLQTADKAVSRNQAGRSPSRAEQLERTEGATLRKVALKKVWHAGKKWKVGGVVGWEPAFPEKGSPYRLHLDGGMVLETSQVQAIEETPNEWIIKTANSVYQLTDLDRVRQEKIQTGSQPRKPMAWAGRDPRLSDTAIEKDK